MTIGPGANTIQAAISYVYQLLTAYLVHLVLLN